MKQRITFRAELVVDDEAVGFDAARRLVRQALLDGDAGEVTYTLDLVKVTRLELLEEK